MSGDWYDNHHAYERKADYYASGYDCAVCGEDRQHAWHRFREPLAEAVADHNSGTTTSTRR